MKCMYLEYDDSTARFAFYVSIKKTFWTYQHEKNVSIHAQEHV